MPVMPNMDSFHKPCGVPNCMPCAFITMSSYFNAMNAFASSCNITGTIMSNEQVNEKTIGHPNVRKEPLVSKSKGKNVKTNTDQGTINVKAKHVKAEVVHPIQTPTHLDLRMFGSESLLNQSVIAG